MDNSRSNSGIHGVLPVHYLEHGIMTQLKIRRQRCCPADRDMSQRTWPVRIYTCGVQQETPWARKQETAATSNGIYEWPERE